MKGRLWRVVLVLGATLTVCGALVASIVHKATDPRWESCGIGSREVRSLVIGEGGVLAVAANAGTSGDIFTSTDACRSFAPEGIEASVVWSVSWLPHARELCAGADRGLICIDRHSTKRLRIADGNLNYAIEGGGGVLAGGASLYRAPTSNSAFLRVATLSYASHSVVVSAHQLLADGGDGLLISTDDGKTWLQVKEDFRAGLLAGIGDRVYAGERPGESAFHVSDDGGLTWRDVGSLPSTQPEVILLPTEDPEVVIVGTHGDVRRGDAYFSDDGGRHWRALGCPGAEIDALAVDDHYLYCGATALLGRRGLWRLRLSILGLEGRTSARALSSLRRVNAGPGSFVLAPEGAGFRVTFPGEPKITSSNIDGGFLGTAVWKNREKAEVLATSWFDLDFVDDAEARARVESTISDRLRGRPVRIIDRARISIGGRNGIEVRYLVEDQVTIERWLWNTESGRNVLIEATTPSRVEGDATAMSFLDSFEPLR